MLELDFNSADFAFVDMPDGMPNINLDARLSDLKKANEDCAIITVHARLTDAASYMKLRLFGSILDRLCPNCRKTLNIRYLSVGRMDRSVKEGWPFTLEQSVYISGFEDFWDDIFVQCPHSEVTEQLVGERIVWKEEQFFSWAYMYFLLHNFSRTDLVKSDTTCIINLVIPDKGALKRFAFLDEEFQGYNVVVCEKVRDPVTAKLTGFEIARGAPIDAPSLIVDDLCDGGRTFTGIADAIQSQQLKLYKATKPVSLAVYHGIFSAGLPITNIKHVYTTDSFADRENSEYLTVDYNTKVLF